MIRITLPCSFSQNTTNRMRPALEIRHQYPARWLCPGRFQDRGFEDGDSLPDTDWERLASLREWRADGQKSGCGRQGLQIGLEAVCTMTAASKSSQRRPMLLKPFLSCEKQHILILELVQ